MIKYQNNIIKKDKLSMSNNNKLLLVNNQNIITIIKTNYKQ